MKRLLAVGTLGLIAWVMVGMPAASASEDRCFTFGGCLTLGRDGGVVSGDVTTRMTASSPSCLRWTEARIVGSHVSSPYFVLYPGHPHQNLSDDYSTAEAYGCSTNGGMKADVDWST